MTINDDFQPLVISFAYHKKGGLSLVNLNDTVDIQGQQKNISQLLSFCNGLRTLKSIKQYLPNMHEKDFLAALELLRKNGVIVDSREYYSIFHAYAAFPLSVAYNKSALEIERTRKKHTKYPQSSEIPLVEDTKGALTKLLRARKSTRLFGDTTLTMLEFSSLLQSMYSLTDTRPVPSAGAFYAMSIFVLILRPIDSIAPGCYLYDARKHALQPVKNITISHRVLSIIFNSEVLLKNATAVFCVSADFSKPSVKYANRAYRHVLLEAGHIAQNAYLSAAENHIGIVECGGFNDQELARLLKLTYPQKSVVTTLVVGSKGEKGQYQEPYKNEERKLREALAGEHKPVKGVFQVFAGEGQEYQMPYYAACAKYAVYGRPKDVLRSAFGTGITLEEAKVKALSESFERYISGKARVDVFSSARSLRAPFFDLNAVAPQRDEYLKRVHLRKLTADMQTSWTSGRFITSGKKVFVPTEEVFYPVSKKELGHPLSYLANSTGVAAHFSAEQAFENALLELIERDAIGVTWYGRRTPTQIPARLLSEEIQFRLNSLAHVGRKVHFLDITTDTVPVVLCLITGDVYPYLTTGCAAGFSYERAIEKALNESEFVLHSWRGVSRTIKAEDIRSVADHADFYARKQIYCDKDISWLLRGRAMQAFPTRKKQIQEVIAQLNPIVVNMAHDRQVGLTVVRVLSSHLMPLTFGFGAEHYGHPRVAELGCTWAWKYPALPHLLA